jgi:hypothetical protein
VRHVTVCESKVPVPPLALDDDQLGIEQFRKMRADRLLGQIGDSRQLRSRQRRACHQCREDFSTRVVTD